MDLPSLAGLQRRRRQLETLRKMLEATDQLIEMIQDLHGKRELNSDEECQAAAIVARRERIKASITEAGG